MQPSTPQTRESSSPATPMIQRPGFKSPVIFPQTPTSIYRRKVANNPAYKIQYLGSPTGKGKGQGQYGPSSPEANLTPSMVGSGNGYEIYQDEPSHAYPHQSQDEVHHERRGESGEDAPQPSSTQQEIEKLIEDMKHELIVAKISRKGIFSHLLETQDKIDALDRKLDELIRSINEQDINFSHANPISSQPTTTSGTA